MPQHFSSLLSPDVVLVFWFSTEISDDDNSIAQMYQLISQLPQPNRDTLAFLAVHFQRSVVTVDSHLVFTLLLNTCVGVLAGY